MSAPKGAFFAMEAFGAPACLKVLMPAVPRPILGRQGLTYIDLFGSADAEPGECSRL